MTNIEKLVRWNIELPMKNTGAGLVPEWRPAYASFSRKGGSESCSLEASQPHFDHPSVEFQTASEDPVQTSSPAPTSSREAEF